MTRIGPLAAAGDSDAQKMAVVVVNYGSHALIERNLGDLEMPGPGVHVVIVDNFSSAAERAAIEGLANERGWQLLCGPNVGFGAGANLGLQAALRAGCDCFLVLNPDAHAETAVIEALAQHCREDTLALITPRLTTTRGTVVFEGSQVFLDTGRIKRQRSTAIEASHPAAGGGRAARAWLPGTCLALHRELLERVGGFDEPYFLYWEDLDFSVRCEDAGGTLVVRQDLVAVHDEGGTQERRDDRALSSRYYYWNCRNRLLFASRHLSNRQILKWMWHTPVESWQILMRGGRRQLLHSPAPLVATVRGSLAGIRIAVLRLARGAQR